MNETISMFHENAHILKGENIRNYIEGGHAVVTLKSPTGKHYTYAFTTPRNSKYPDTRYVKVHFENDWVYIGRYYHNHNRGYFSMANQCLFPDWHEAIKGMNYLVRMVNDVNLNTPMQIYHEGVCCRCGRKLTDPKFIELGIGPKCAKMSRIIGGK